MRSSVGSMRVGDRFETHGGWNGNCCCPMPDDPHELKPQIDCELVPAAAVVVVLVVVDDDDEDRGKKT